jgi:peptidoglycan/xylan/chitin deacetylase (PgdA/CDA1 family)
MSVVTSQADVTARRDATTAERAPAGELVLPPEALAADSPAKQWARRCCDRISAAVSRLRRRATGSLRFSILCYHRVTDDLPGVPAAPWNVTPQQFRSQMEGLLNRGFQAWSLREVLHAAKVKRNIPPRVFVVTFDDGFASVLTEAAPILRGLGIPASLFLTTAYIDRPDPFPFDYWADAQGERVPRDAYRTLTWEECRRLVTDYRFEIGTHTHTHRDFRGSPHVFQAELAESASILNTELGGDAKLGMSYPFGGSRQGFSTHDMQQAAKAAGVLCGLTTDPVTNDVTDDPFAWGRIRAEAWDTADTLTARMAGCDLWALLGRLRYYFYTAAPRGGEN